MPLLRSTLLAGLLLVCAGCENPFGLASSSLVTLPVKDVVVPDRPSRDAPFTVTLTVVTGGCRSFERIHGDRSAGRLVLTAIGKDTGGKGIVCPTHIILEEHSYPVSPPFADQFTIAARQPDGSEMVRQIQFE